MTESRERAVIATATLLSSLAFYEYARSKGKSEVPYLMFGAFVGAIMAELALLQMSKNQQP